MIKIKINGEDVKVQAKVGKLDELLRDIKRLDIVRNDLLNEFNKRMYKDMSELYKKDGLILPEKFLKRTIEEITDEELKNMKYKIQEGV